MMEDKLKPWEMPDELYVFVHCGAKGWTTDENVANNALFSAKYIKEESMPFNGVWTKEMRIACMKDAAEVCRLTEENKRLKTEKQSTPEELLEAKKWARRFIKENRLQGCIAEKHMETLIHHAAIAYGDEK